MNWSLQPRSFQIAVFKQYEPSHFGTHLAKVLLQSVLLRLENPYIIVSLQEAGGDIVDCSRLGSSAHVISGDLNLQQKFQSDARYILVVEKVLTP
jgi:hypothetical protein